jgi:cyanophycinase
LVFLFQLFIFCQAGHTAGFKYKRTGNKSDVTTPTEAGYALMGGGSDLDEVFRWLCDKGKGGDFLILRARGSADYNPYVKKLCKLNSVATLVIPDREAASDRKVAETIRQAEAIFIAGGDQARYLNFWQKTPVQEELNRYIAASKPIGGTSAGLAVLGEFVYSAQGDDPKDADLKSSQTLVDPFMPRVTVRKDFLKIELLKNTLTDTHFKPRDRMGRSLTFLARVIQDGWSKNPREIAVDEKSAVLLESDGSATVVGTGAGAYFMETTAPPEVCREKTPLTFRNIDVYRVGTGSTFDLKSWEGKGGVGYRLSVNNGKVESTQAGGAVY